MDLRLAPLPRANAASGRFQWTPQAVRLVGNLCHDDIHRFGFKPPNSDQ